MSCTRFDPDFGAVALLVFRTLPQTTDRTPKARRSRVDLELVRVFGDRTPSASEGARERPRCGPRFAAGPLRGPSCGPFGAATGEPF